MKTRHRILSVSYDRTLLATRGIMLEQAGYEVDSVTTAEDAAKRADGAELIIMGHSIPREERAAILAAIRARGCDAPVLALLRPNESAPGEAALSVDTEPHAVLAAVEGMLQKRKADRN